MIRVSIKTRKDLIESLEITGHADFLEKGRDIVCAAASLVGTGLLNALDDIAPGKCELVKEENRIYVKVLENDSQIQTALHTGEIQYQTLSEAFPRYVKTKKTEVKL
ncbi:MAG: ribosomal-processing cysteine protease Prp [Erysipelotrichaceae bacterium]|nr:ribosomal-processing cysteine protease Prp [Erysipelotrichaceae bacterium]